MALQAGRVGVAKNQVDEFGHITGGGTPESVYTKSQCDSKFELKSHIGGLKFRDNNGTAQYMLPNGEWTNFNNGAGGGNEIDCTSVAPSQTNRGTLVIGFNNSSFDGIEIYSDAERTQLIGQVKNLTQQNKYVSLVSMPLTTNLYWRLFNGNTAVAINGASGDINVVVSTDGHSCNLQQVFGQFYFY